MSVVHFQLAKRVRKNNNLVSSIEEFSNFHRTYFRFLSKIVHMYREATGFQAVVAEWLRRWTWNPMGSPRVGSNPAGSALFFDVAITFPCATKVPSRSSRTLKFSDFKFLSTFSRSLSATLRLHCRGFFIVVFTKSKKRGTNSNHKWVKSEPLIPAQKSIIQRLLVVSFLWLLVQNPTILMMEQKKIEKTNRGPAKTF